MGGGGCTPTPTRKGPFPSMYPLGVNRAIPEYHLFEQKGFLSAIADVSVSQHSRTDISQGETSHSSLCRELSWEMNINRSSSADKTPWRWVPEPPWCPSSCCCGAGGRGPGCLGTLPCPRRCRAGALLWKLGKYPRKSVGAGLGAEVGHPPVGAGLASRVRTVPSPLYCCPAAVLLLLLVEGERNGICLLSLGGRDSQHWSLNHRTTTVTRALHGYGLQNAFCASLLLFCYNCLLPRSKYYYPQLHKL